MKLQTIFLVWFCLAIIPSCAYAQGAVNGDDDPSFSSSMGLSLSAPLSPVSHYVSSGLGTDYSAGYNFDRRNAVVGEFMWNHLFASGPALQPLRDALQSPNVHAHGDLFAFTADYKFEMRGSLHGVYVIGGGGWYHRTAGVTTQIPIGGNVVCQPVWLWWGYTCSSGTVDSSHTVAGSSSSAFGGNGGIGYTVRVGDAPYRFYVETRYHYAPTRNITTQLLAISVGFRY